jgi:6-phosphogluconolactonase
MTIEFQKFGNRTAMVSALADTIANCLLSAIDSRGEASLIVSGGSTPKILFGVLASMALPWNKVTISLTDERWVDPASEDSNEYLVRTTLLVRNAAAAKFVTLKNNRATPVEGEDCCEAALGAISSPFDMVLLGMGDDGHTASLFPYTADLKAALDMNSGRQCKAITPRELPAHAPYPRLTMTLPRLLNSRRIVLLLNGQSKLDVYNEALAGDDVSVMPVRAILKQTVTPVITYWAA